MVRVRAGPNARPTAATDDNHDDDRAADNANDADRGKRVTPMGAARHAGHADDTNQENSREASMNRITLRMALAGAGLCIAACGEDASRVAMDARMQPASGHPHNAARVIDFHAARQPAALTRDAAITAAIRAGLLEFMSLGAVKIDVRTEEGVVTLNGTAPDRDAAQRAERIARSVEGVKDVRNNLVRRWG